MTSNEAGSRGPRPRAILRGTLAAGLALVLLIAAPIVAGNAVSAVSGAVGFDVAAETVEDLDPLGERSVIYAADGSVLAVLHDEVDREVIELSAIPDHVIGAVLTAEDRRFYEHSGYDIEGIARAAVANLRAREISQGGSTITQQLAKSLVGSDQSWQRKMRELVHALALEERYDKDELLERYLNQVYFGGGAYGLAAAAEEFFRAELDELTAEQAALLAGLIRAPNRLDPRRHPDRAVARRNSILSGMAAEGYLDAEEAQRLQQQPLDVAPPLDREPTAPYIVEVVKREILADERIGESRAERLQMLFSGGLRIHTSIDPRLQRIAHEAVTEGLAGHEGPAGAILALDHRSGRVLAMRGGEDFERRQFNLATQGRRQPGSAFKPFVLATALEQGYPMELRLPGSSPQTYEPSGHIEPWEVSNYGGASYGRVALNEALTRSVNTAFAQLILVVGADKTAAMLERLGIDLDAATGGDLVPAMALGGLPRGLTVLEMAAAYGVFANQGIRVPPKLIDRVEDASGHEIVTREPEAEVVLHETIAATVIDAMQNVVRAGTGRRAALSGWQAAGKTGTSQELADAWFVGSVPTLTTAVWVGHPEGRVAMPGMTGGSAPARIWNMFMSQALEGVEPRPFPEPSTPLDALLADHQLEIPDVRGERRAEALQTLADEGLVGTVRMTDSTASAGRVIWQHPAPGASVHPGVDVQIGVSTGRPPPPPEDDDDGEDEESEDEESEDEEPEDEEPEDEKPEDEEPEDEKPEDEEPEGDDDEAPDDEEPPEPGRDGPPEGEQAGPAEAESDNDGGSTDDGESTADSGR